MRRSTINSVKYTLLGKEIFSMMQNLSMQRGVKAKND
jgi:hypothetical protein